MAIYVQYLLSKLPEWNSQWQQCRLADHR